MRHPYSVSGLRTSIGQSLSSREGSAMGDDLLKPDLIYQ